MSTSRQITNRLFVVARLKSHQFVATTMAIIVILVTAATAFSSDNGPAVVSQHYGEAESQQEVDPTAVPAQTERAGTVRPRIKFRLRGDISENYDSNILDYSDTDRAVFGSPVSLQKKKFGITRLDDHITDINVRLSAEYGRRREAWILRLKGDATLFSYNSFRRYYQWGMELRKNINRAYIMASFSWLPKYNLRNLYWRPMPGRPIGVTYAPAVFSKHLYNLEIGYEVSPKFDSKFNFGLNSTNYDYPFDERDNKAYSEMVRVTYDLTRRITLSGGFGFAQLRAAGRDSVNNEMRANNVAKANDISYNARLAEFGIRYKVDRRGHIVASSAVNYQHQNYLSVNQSRSGTGHLYDGHYHRLDDDYEINSSISWRVTPYLQPELSYDYRTTKSVVAPNSAGEFGAFTAHRFGMQLTYLF